MRVLSGRLGGVDGTAKSEPNQRAGDRRSPTGVHAGHEYTPQLLRRPRPVTHLDMLPGSPTPSTGILTVGGDWVASGDDEPRRRDDLRRCRSPRVDAPRAHEEVEPVSINIKVPA